jgi:peptide/nickel transport system permease protein
MNTTIAMLIGKRISIGVLLLFAVSGLIFAGTEILPGDVAQSILGQSATPETVAALRQQLGLNNPAWIRYAEWLGGVMTGDLGQSLSNGQDIAVALGDRLGNTFFLALVAAMISVPLAVSLGLIAVRFKGRWPDKAISGLTLASISLPEFFIGYLLIYVFSVKLGWFTSNATVYADMPLAQRLYVITLPTMTLTLVVLAHMMRMTRAAVLAVMQSQYIETAELKGVSPLKIVYKHALPNAIAPIINVIMLNMAYLVVGVVVVEVVFNYPGVGQFLVDHVAKRDVPVVQACGLIFAGVFILFNIVADVASILANPRLRHPK